MSLGSTGPGGVQSSAPTKPIERPEAASIDPSQISFAGVLAQLFQSIPTTSTQPDLGAVATPVRPSDPAPPRDVESPTAEPREEVQEPPVQDADRNDPPEDSAADEQPMPPEVRDREAENGDAPARPEPDATRSEPVAATAPVVVETMGKGPLEAPSTPPAPAPRPMEPPSEPILSRVETPMAPPQDSQEPASPAPTVPQEPPATGEGRVKPHAATPAAPAPPEVALPPIVRSAEGSIDAPALGAAPAPVPLDPAAAPPRDHAAQAGPDGAPGVPRLDVVSASSQVTAAGVAPVTHGAEAGLDARTGPQGATSPPAVAGTGGASSGTPAADMGQATAPRRVDPGPIIDRVVRGMRLSMKSGQSRMRFLLTPPSLGSVTVDLEVKHGVLSAHLAADSAEARDLLSRNIAALTDSLREQGIRVGDVMVSARQDGERGNGAHGQAGNGLPAPSGGEAPIEDPRAYAEERRRLQSRDRIVDLMA